MVHHLSPVIRLNLGAGNQPYVGYTGVDMSGWAADVKHDLTTPLPFADNTVDEIFASHVVEHFPLWQIQKLLLDWHRALKPGGLFWGLVPDGPEVAKRYLEAVEQKDWGIKRICIANFCGGYTNNEFIGDGQIHYAVYDQDMLTEVLGNGRFHPILVTPVHRGPMDYALLFACGKGVYPPLRIQDTGVYPGVPWRRPWWDGEVKE